MKTHKPLKVVAVVLSVLMLFSAIPMTAFAAWQDDNVVYNGSTFGTNGYYNVISKKDYTLVPGAATETEMVINNSAGNRRNVMHIIEVDPSNPDVSILPGYYNIDKDLSDYNNWKAAGVTDLVKYYEDDLGYNVVGAMNTDLDYSDNAPRVLVYNGQDLAGYAAASAPKSVLCVYKDANDNVSVDVKAYSKTEIDNELANGHATRGQLLHAISVSFAMTVKNGELVSKTEERTSDKAARSMVGVKEDGTLVLVMNDGRGANNSVGFNNYELGESMLALGCKWAANCDGGGSSSIVTKRAGETEGVCRCVPCDGAERPTKSSVVVVSNVGPTGELNNVNINSDYDYFAPGVTYDFSAEAIDTHGYAMDMPADASWALSDASFGTINNGTFTSSGTVGDVDVQVHSGGNVVGTKTIHIANPTELSLSASETTLPYSTADKVRTTNIPMVAKIGENDVYTSGAYNISVSPANGGTVDGLKFTATDDTSVASAVVTITYVPTSQQFTYTVNYGKGSEVLWDFEDGDISAWVGTDQADQMMRDHGCELTTSGDWSTPFRTLTSGGQISWSNKTTTKLSSVAEGGQAHSGDKSLAVTFDMKNVEFNSWVYSIIWNMQGNVVLRDVANGKNATAFGCWVYVPKGFYTAKNNGAQALQLTVQRGTSSTAALTGNQLNLQYNGKNINALKESDIPENRWVYVKADLTAYNYVKLVDPYNDVYRSPSFIRMYVKPSEAQEMTYYFDDWTLDYSSAVDDRQPPVISNPTYCTNDTNIAFDNQTITTNVVSFDANIADTVASNAEGLDYNTAKIYVDGIAQRNVRASGNSMGIQNVVLSNGVHKITFEIADKLGNSTTLTKQLTVNADAAKAAVRLAGHNDKNNGIEAGSVYYVDVKADAIENIDSVTTTVELQSAHEWELDHMIVAKGFEASYELNSVKDNIATITVTKTGNTSLTGEQTLVSLPARVWSFDENTWVGGDSNAAPTHKTAAQRYATSYGEPVLLMEANVLYGEVGYTDNTAGTFGGSISETTEVTGNKLKVWHEHNAEPLEDKAATCTEDGYSGRTYCDECGSVIDWGTTVPATGHTYELVEDQFVCSECGDVYQPGTGLFEMNGKTYYAINNNLMKSWQFIDDTWYFFNNDYSAKVGSMKYASVTYEFNEDGSLVSGVWRFDGTGYRYYFGPDYYRCTAANPYANTLWVDIDGNRYAFDRQGHRHSGISMLIESNTVSGMFEFTEDGVLVGKYETDYTGVFPCNNGKYTYLENGFPTNHGLAEYEGNYYYFNSSRLNVTGTYHCTNHMTAEIPAGTYEFDETGKMINPPVVEPTTAVETTEPVVTDPVVTTEAAETDPAPTEAVKNGIIRENGKLYYYENGAKKQVGLINIDGDWYYVRSGGIVATGTYYCTYKMTNQIPAGQYEFDENGKMLNVPVVEPTTTTPVVTDPVVTTEPVVTEPAPTEPPKNGIVRENGKLYYYENGAKKQVGLINIDGDWYYVRSGGIVATGTYHCTYKMTSQIPAGTYEFDENGKMLNVPGQGGTDPVETTEPVVTDPIETTEPGPTEPLKNGIVSENGKLYYYENGARKQVGLINIDGDWYYVRSAGVVATGTYYCTYRMTDLIPAGQYEFDETGKMINPPQPVYKDGFVEENGGIFYYKDNVLQKDLGVIVVDGNYYYVRSNGQLATGEYSIDYNTNDYVRGGKHQFGADGKMVVDPTFLVGIRGGRDIAYLNQTSSDVKVKPGMFYRGSELDGAYYDPSYATITEEDTQNGVALLTEKGVVFDMDLRAQNPKCKDVLGDDVTHKYYDMVFYDNVFTDAGKAKVKELFTDLANPDNYPLYCHCTYGLDRTGTVCYLVEALLGFSDWNLSHDYCGTIRSHEASILKIRDGLAANYAGDTRQEQVTNYLLSCGVTQQQIDTIKQLLLDTGE